MTVFSSCLQLLCQQIPIELLIHALLFCFWVIVQDFHVISVISVVQCCVTMLLLLLLLQLYHIRHIRLSELSSMLSPSPFWFVVSPGLPFLLSLKMSDGLVFLRSPSSPIPISVYHFALTLSFHYREYRVILIPCSGTAC